MDEDEPVTADGPRVHLLCGLVAAGKSTYARRLASELPAARFCLDEWMLRLYGLRFDTPEYAERLGGCTALIWDTALDVLRLGHDVVLDWNQWSRERRASWRARVEAAGYQPVLHWIDVPLDVAIERARSRAAEGQPDAHVVDEAGVRHHGTIFEPPSAAEGFELRVIDG